MQRAKRDLEQTSCYERQVQAKLHAVPSPISSRGIDPQYKHCANQPFRTIGDARLLISPSPTSWDAHGTPACSSAPPQRLGTPTERPLAVSSVLLEVGLVVRSRRQLAGSALANDQQLRLARALLAPVRACLRLARACSRYSIVPSHRAPLPPRSMISKGRAGCWAPGLRVSRPLPLSREEGSLAPSSVRLHAELRGQRRP